MSDKVSILAISGSLRPNASNNIILRYLSGLVPTGVIFNVYENLAAIPAFNDSEEAPPAVVEFRKLLADADAVLICSPEYAFGIPGALKNAIDWTVSSG